MPSHASIVITSHNYARFLPSAIDGALGQEGVDVEVIVVDDGSTDETPDVLRRYHRHLRVLRQPGRGQTSAMNAGFCVSAGEVVCFLDADDVLMPQAMRTALEAMSDPKVVNVNWHHRPIDAEGRLIGVRDSTRRNDEPVPRQPALRQQLLRLGPSAIPIPPTSSHAWRRVFLEEVMPLPETLQYYSDACLFMLAQLKGDVQQIDEPLTLFRIHGDNNYASMDKWTRNEQDVRAFTHRCALLDEHCRRMGLECDPALWPAHSWSHRLRGAVDDIAGVVPAGKSFGILDEARLCLTEHPELRALPFPERDGAYAGHPSGGDDELIDELSKLRRQGAEHLAIAWPAFWWLEHYTAFASRLKQGGSALLHTPRVVIYRLPD